MFLQWRLAMPSLERENVRHATLLFCAEGVGPWNNNGAGEKEIAMMNLKRIREVYVVAGKGNSGKTTALCEICEDLKAAAVSIDEHRLGTGADRFFKAKLHDGRVVGVGTAGDTAGFVLENFLYFSEIEQACDGNLRDSGCDVVVIALSLNDERKARLYKPNRSSAEIALYDVIFPGFMPNFTEATKVVKTTRFTARCKNYEQSRIRDRKQVVGELKSLLKI